MLDVLEQKKRKISKLQDRLTHINKTKVLLQRGIKTVFELKYKI